MGIENGISGASHSRGHVDQLHAFNFQREQISSTKDISQLPNRLGNLDVIYVSGSASERGIEHGIQLAHEIAECYKIYRGFWPSINDVQLEQFVKEQKEYIKGAFPHYLEEMEGIAKGSKVPLDNIIALNSRTELAHYNAKIARAQGSHATPVNECTLVGDCKTAVMGQNWDWADSIEPLTKIIHITLEDGHQILTMTEPGILGKVGMNSAGIGVGLNFIPGTSAGGTGLPVHLLLRRCLEAHSLGEINNMLYEMQSERLLNTMSSISVMDRNGEAAVYEILGSEIFQIKDGNKRTFAHTNHPVVSPTGYGTEDLDDSLTRIKDASQMAEKQPVTVSALKKILADRSNPDYPINMKPLSWGVIGDVLSIRSVIFDLRKGEFHISTGAPGYSEQVPEYDVAKLY